MHHVGAPISSATVIKEQHCYAPTGKLFIKWPFRSIKASVASAWVLA